MKVTNNKLAEAVRVGLVAGFATIAFAGVASAQSTSSSDDDKDQATSEATASAKSVGKVTVTGSRLKRAEVEGAQPVTVINREALEATGKTSVADVLQNSTFNSFGANKPSSGSSAQSFSEMSLRGLGGGRTLILIDGRRAPLSPQFAEGGQNLNTIPLAAVERIEILTDGASAIYGADAMAGVVNIITRKDFNGVELTGGVATSKRGGDRHEGNAIFGASGERGSLIGGVSYADRGINYIRDYPWTGRGNSTFGNNYKNVLTDPNTGKKIAGGFLPGTTSVPPGGCNDLNFYLNPSKTRCLYDTNVVAADTAGIKTKGMFLKGSYNINDAWTIGLDASVTRLQSNSVFAPTPEHILLSANSPNNVIGREVFLAHRFAALGNRLTDDNTTTTDMNLTLQGQINDRWSMDFGLRRADSSFSVFGRNYVNIPVAKQLFDSGEYNIFNPLGNSQKTLDKMRTTISRNGFYKMNELFALSTLELFEMGGGNAQWGLGAEYREEDYANIYDAQSAAGNVGGSAGNSSWGDRRLGSLFTEINLPISKMLEINLAARHDRYSDFGNSTNPKASIRFQPFKNLMLRASYGEGFRAPSLSIMNQLDSFSADTVADRQTAIAWGLPATSSMQINGLRVATKDLKPETSKNLSFGVVYDPTSWLSLTADAYDIKGENTIRFYSAQTVVNRTTAGIYLPPNLGVTRNPDGSIAEVRAGYGNEGSFHTNGVDFTARTRYNLGGARVSHNLITSWINKWETSGPYSAPSDAVGTSGAPRWRATLANQWNYGDFGFAWNINALANTDTPGYEAYKEDYTCQELVDFGYYPQGRCDTGVYVTHDIQFNYNTPWNGKVAFGATNVLSKDPPIDKLGIPTTHYDGSLFDPYGREIYFRYTQRF